MVFASTLSTVLLLMDVYWEPGARQQCFAAQNRVINPLLYARSRSLSDGDEAILLPMDEDNALHHPPSNSFAEVLFC
jgi:hypothetical protein